MELGEFVMSSRFLGWGGREGGGEFNPQENGKEKQLILQSSSSSLDKWKEETNSNLYTDRAESQVNGC